ncbi:hypothetical protein [Xanthomonas sacchari]|uniref:hypothetical protein n=1 Tax=Xanthomonas sacchari TaxID=56458 RepID=UPI00224FD8C5|nr:hypothetical protein [Xanthomonas sacchari]UYK72914.1 hypothetical protein NG828_00740 [Xanthomonas sacchari]
MISKPALDQILDKIIEELAAIEHKRWAHWQSYLHSLCSLQNDGSLVIPSQLVERWERQIATTYKNLSEDEKESDRDQVREYLKVIKETILAQ